MAESRTSSSVFRTPPSKVKTKQLNKALKSVIVVSQTPEMHAYDLDRELQLVSTIEERVAEENLGFD